MADYKATPGFFDLTEKPEGMSNKQHKKIQDMQMLLISESRKYQDPAVREANYRAFDKLRNYMAELQFIIIQLWPHEVLFK